MSSSKATICIWEDKAVCEICNLKGKLHCHLNHKISIIFMLPFLLFSVPTLIGLILLSFPLNVIVIGSWIGYMVFFFMVWEPPILCAHCPFYAEDAKILHCSINYGFYKTAKFNPKPISLSEKIQFVIGANLLFIIPMIFLIIGHMWLYLGLSVAGTITWYLVLQFKICTVCINFSCIFNRAPKDLKEQFLHKKKTYIRGVAKRRTKIIVELAN